METIYETILKSLEGKHYQHKAHSLRIVTVSSKPPKKAADATGFPLEDSFGKRQYFLGLWELGSYEELSPEVFEKIKRWKEKGLKEKIIEDFEIRHGYRK